jgi:hypothetical protein
VGERGLEPPRLAAQPPQGCVYTNFTTHPKLTVVFYHIQGVYLFLSSSWRRVLQINTKPLGKRLPDTLETLARL